jgi:hypothetical protein
MQTQPFVTILGPVTSAPAASLVPMNSGLEGCCSIQLSYGHAMGKKRISDALFVAIFGLAAQAYIAEFLIYLTL